MSKKVAIYCRVSTIEQAEEGFSIDSQYHNIKEYCKNQGHEIYNLYEDRGISGKNITNRPGIKQLLEDATKNKPTLIINNMGNIYHETIINKRAYLLAGSANNCDGLNLRLSTRGRL